MLFKSFSQKKKTQKTQATYQCNFTAVMECQVSVATYCKGIHCNTWTLWWHNAEGETVI